MSRTEIQVGNAFTNSKEIFARVVMEITPDGDVVYRDFGLSDGKPIGSGRCSLGTFLRWSARPLTDSERTRFRWEESYEQDFAFIQGLLARIPDPLLLAEVHRRGLDRELGR